MADAVPVQAPPNVVGGMILTLPIYVAFREPVSADKFNGARLYDTCPLVSRVVRNAFNVPHGAVKVLSDPPCLPAELPGAYAHLGLSHDRTPDTTQEESAMLIADIIMRNFDAALVHEMLGAKLATGVKR